MIYIERTITIKKNQARIEQPIVLYKGDRNIELQFIIENNPFKYKAGTDVTYGQLVIKRPKAAPIFSEPAKMSSSKVLFIVTGDMIDELDELGNYDFQIRLLNTDQSSRGSLPEVTGGIIIKEPLCEEATVNATSVNDSNAYVMRANNTVMLALDDSDGIFDEEGNYNRTNWHGGDIITDVRLNRVEEALYQINDDIPTDYVTEEYVNDKDRNTRNYVADNYTTKVYVDQAIGNIDVDLTGYATEEYVDDAIRNIDIPEVDLDGYATESYVNEVMPDIIEIGNEDGSVYNFTGLEFSDEEYENGVGKNVILNNVLVQYSGNGVFSEDTYYNELVYIRLRKNGDYRDFTIYSSSRGKTSTYRITGGSLALRDEKNYITHADVAWMDEQIWTMDEQIYSLNEQIANIGDNVDLTGYATEQYVDDAITNIEMPDIMIIGTEDGSGYYFTGDEFTDLQYKHGVRKSVFLKDVYIDFLDEYDEYDTMYYENELAYIFVSIREPDHAKCISIHSLSGGVSDFYFTENNELKGAGYNSYATKEELQTALGDINAILDAINGEEV